MLLLSIDIPAEMKSCPIGMFCPIGANCTNNATLCVVMCPTESDIMQQGNYVTGNCERGSKYVAITFTLEPHGYWQVAI